MSENAPLSTAPFLPSTQDDQAVAAQITREMDALASTCRDEACDQVHYTRGLVALFESREAAQTSFRRVSQAAPHNPFAVSSAAWLHLLEGGTWESLPQQQAVIDVTTQLIREWIARKLEELREDKKTPASLTKSTSVIEAKGAKALQRQLRDRDRRIAELMSQLETLKAIDQDVVDRKRFSRPAAVLMPVIGVRDR